MTERIFSGFIDEIADGFVKAVGECNGEDVFIDIPLDKWPIGRPKKPGVIFFIDVNGAFTDITFPADDSEIPNVKLGAWNRFMLWLKRLAN